MAYRFERAKDLLCHTPSLLSQINTEKVLGFVLVNDEIRYWIGKLVHVYQLCSHIIYGSYPVRLDKFAVQDSCQDKTK